jgi:hypothetical protein
MGRFFEHSIFYIYNLLLLWTFQYIPNHGRILIGTSY